MWNYAETDDLGARKTVKRTDGGGQFDRETVTDKDRQTTNVDEDGRRIGTDMPIDSGTVHQCLLHLTKVRRYCHPRLL